MDYVVGSVAALISGNVTPNRPRPLKRALTPKKHQPSPNVTPKSEFVNDRSIFLSPTLQKKKAIVKKSPKRIFQNPDPDVTDDGEGISKLTSPKADKVKKHLTDDLNAEDIANTSNKNKKSPKKGKNNLNKSVDSALAIEKSKNDDVQKLTQSFQVNNESTPKKKKKPKISMPTPTKSEKSHNKENLASDNSEIESESPNKAKRKSVSESSDATDKTTAMDTDTVKVTPKKKKRKSITTEIEKSSEDNQEQMNILNNETNKSPKKIKKRKLKESQGIVTQNVNQEDDEKTKAITVENVPKKKKNKKKKKKAKTQTDNFVANTESNIPDQEEHKMVKKSKTAINPNAITNKDSDSEHESDNEIDSETEETNKEILETGPASSDEEEEDEKPKKAENKTEDWNDAEVVKRTLFVGNVPFSNKCKKEMKKIFNKYGHIETVRIRTVPVKDARVTPKLAVIKNELHPDRSSVNLYIKFSDPDSVDKALAENNTVINGHHLRVTRSDNSGSHDHRRSVFVGNLPFALEDDALRDKFEKCGEIESVRIIRDKKTNVGKGFGYVNFKTKDGVELALALTEEDLTIKNRILRVKRCTMAQTKKGPNRPTHGQKFQNQRNERPGQRNERQGHQHNQGRGNFQGRGRFQGLQRGGGEGKQMDGAYRRVMNKRQSEERGEGPPNKKIRDNQEPAREKKPRKEFVGQTAEKKKKRKFDKSQKKKKAISEILSK